MGIPVMCTGGVCARVKVPHHLWLFYPPLRYAHAGEADPKVLLTTSRDPSSRLVQFAKVWGGREGGRGGGEDRREGGRRLREAR